MLRAKFRSILLAVMLGTAAAGALGLASGIALVRHHGYLEVGFWRNAALTTQRGILDWLPIGLTFALAYVVVSVVAPVVHESLRRAFGDGGDDRGGVLRFVEVALIAFAGMAIAFHPASSDWLLAATAGTVLCLTVGFLRPSTRRSPGLPTRLAVRGVRQPGVAGTLDLARASRRSTLDSDLPRGPRRIRRRGLRHGAFVVAEPR